MWAAPGRSEESALFKKQRNLLWFVRVPPPERALNPSHPIPVTNIRISLSCWAHVKVSLAPGSPVEEDQPKSPTERWKVLVLGLARGAEQLGGSQERREMEPSQELQ